VGTRHLPLLLAISVLLACPAASDQDGDGVLGSSDCDDTNANVYPGQLETTCNGLDDDCSPATPDDPDADADGVSACSGDCDDADPDAFPGAAEACGGADEDCDGLLSPDELDGDGDGYTPCDGDCDDLLAIVYPGAEEVCDGVDNDCSEATSLPEDDLDGDGVPACNGDCDDGDPDVWPGAPELCDGTDNDCDLALPAGEADADGDGVPLCSDDCDDTDPTTAPGAPELCDGLDNDCDSVVPADEGDGDGDGWTGCGGDCDDTDPGISPDADELCDALDTDCDGSPGLDEADLDGDGQPVCAGDCDDGDPAVWDGAPELCNGQDDDCDGASPVDEVDLDGDGLSLCDGDCDEGSADRFPGNPEVCDGVDNDCDGALPASEQDGDGDGWSPCAGDCDDGQALSAPGLSELCDGLDNDCDGAPAADELDGDGDGVAPCAGDCDDADSARYPGAAELCDGVDQDCDGVVPADELDSDGDGLAACAGDCDDSQASCSTDCATDSDADGLADCADACIDADRDGVCAAADCSDSSPYCDADCATDADGDSLPDCEDPCTDLNGDGFGDGGFAWETCPLGPTSPGGAPDCADLFCASALDFSTTGYPPDPSTTGTSLVRAVAVGPDGALHALHRQHNGGGYDLHHSVSNDVGATFSTPVQVNSGDTVDSSSGDLVVAPSGRVHVAWEAQGFGHYHQYSDDDGASWSAPVQLATTPDTSWSQQPAIAVGPDGGLFVAARVGLASSIIDKHVEVVHSDDDGLTWSSPVAADDSTDQDNGVDVAATAGRVHVAWYDFWSEEIRYTRNYGPWDNFAAPTVLNTASPGSGMHPSIAASGDVVLVAWSDASADSMFDIHYAVSVDAGLSWSSDASVPGGDDPGQQSGPAVGINEDGAWFVAWTHQDGSYFEVELSASDDGGATWIQQVEVASPPAEDAAVYDLVPGGGCGVHVAGRHAADPAVWSRSTSGPNAASLCLASPPVAAACADEQLLWAPWAAGSAFAVEQGSYPSTGPSAGRSGVDLDLPATTSVTSPVSGRAWFVRGCASGCTPTAAAGCSDESLYGDSALVQVPGASNCWIRAGRLGAFGVPFPAASCQHGPVDLVIGDALGAAGADPLRLELECGDPSDWTGLGASADFGLLAMDLGSTNAPAAAPEPSILCSTTGGELDDTVASPGSDPDDRHLLESTGP